MTVSRGLSGRVLVVLLVVGCAGLLHGQAQVEVAETQARRWYADGLKNLEAGRQAEGLKDLRMIVDTYPSASVADDAMLAIATYQLESLGDVAAAQATIKSLVASYPNGDATPVAYVLQGRLFLAGDRTPEDLERARAAFERVPGVFPGTSGVPMALFYLGEVERERKAFSEALDAYTRVVSDYRHSSWAARAQLASAACRVAMRQPLDAIETLQRLRQRFPGTPESERAREWNSILYRLYVRAPVEPAYVAGDRVIAVSTGKLQTVVAITPHRGGEVSLALKDGALRYDADGRLVAQITGNKVRGLASDAGGNPILVLEDGLKPWNGNVLRLTTSKAGGMPTSLDDVLACSVAPDGKLIVADGSSKTLLRFQADGRYLGALSALRADRLATNALGDLVALDRATRTISILDRQGRVTGRIAAREARYELRNPVDVAGDDLGHIYVLDRDAAAVLIFGPGQLLLTSFSVPERQVGYFRRATALGVDAAGRLFIYDQAAEHVRVYQ